MNFKFLSALVILAGGLDFQQTGFGVPGGNRFGEQENDKEHRQLVKANRNRNRNIERIGCHKQHGARGSGVRRERGRHTHTKVYKSLS